MVVRVGAGAQEGKHPPGDTESLERRQVVRSHERAAEVERRGPAIGLEHASSSVRRDEVKFRLGRELPADAGGFEEVSQVRATPHAHVLAGIDELTGCRVRERSGSPAESPPRLQHRDLEAAFRERRGTGQSGQPAADDRDSPHGHSPFKPFNWPYVRVSEYRFLADWNATSSIDQSQEVFRRLQLNDGSGRPSPRMAPPRFRRVCIVLPALC
jgi:hypothetical protein